MWFVKQRIGSNIIIRSYFGILFDSAIFLESHSANLTFLYPLSKKEINVENLQTITFFFFFLEKTQTITFPGKLQKMCDPDDDTAARNGVTPPASSSRSRELLMDVDDLDLDGSWPLDQIPYNLSSTSNRMISPIFVSSSSDQPCSPLWAFSDGGVNGNHATAGGYDGERISSASGVSSSSFSLADYPLFLPC